MVVLNNPDCYQLAPDAIRRIPRLSDQVVRATARYWTSMERHKLYISKHGDDVPEVRDCDGARDQRLGDIEISLILVSLIGGFRA